MTRNAIFLIYLLLAPALPSLGATVQISNSCVPAMKFYDKNDYHGANQSWTIVQSKQGFLYFANSAGLLEFDGREWKLYPTPSLLRSIALSDDDVIYGGMQNDFGYWREDKLTRKLTYTSLAKQLNLTLTDDEIWKIVLFDHAVYFHSFRNIYKYNLQDKTLSVINAPSRFQFLFTVNNRLFVQEKVLGLMEVVNNRLIPVLGGEVLTGDCVYGMEPLSSHEILIATMDRGLYRLENDKVSPCPFPCNDYLKKNLIFSTTTLPGRAGYSYKDKYYGEFTFRYDGSSRFDKGHRWGFFPSFSAGWRLSEESFMESYKNNVGDLKNSRFLRDIGKSKRGQLCLSDYLPDEYKYICI